MSVCDGFTSTCRFDLELTRDQECGRKPEEHNRKVCDALMRRKLSLRGRRTVWRNLRRLTGST